MPEAIAGPTATVVASTDLARDPSAASPRPSMFAALDDGERPVVGPIPGRMPVHR